MQDTKAQSRMMHHAGKQSNARLISKPGCTCLTFEKDMCIVISTIWLSLHMLKQHGIMFPEETAKDAVFC